MTQSAFTCSKLTTEILEQGVKYAQSPCSSVSIVNFKQVNAGWEDATFPITKHF